MTSKCQREFEQFLIEVGQLEEARNAKYTLSDEILNSLILSGEIVGKDTNEKINEIGRKHGLLVMADELSVSHRQDDE